MKKIMKSTLLLLAMTAGTGAFVSCSDDDLPAADALFRPVITADNIEHGLVGVEPYMIVTWDEYKTADQYVVSISAVDGTDDRTVTTSETTCRFDTLQYDTDYNISIRSENTVNGMSSKDFILTTTSLDYPTELATVQSSDVIDTQVRLKWGGEDYVQYDSIAIIHDSKDSLVASVVLEKDATTGEWTAESQEIIDSREVIVRELDPSTSYRAEAYLNGEYKGKKRFSTVAPESYDGIVIDLRKYSADESYKWFSVGSESVYGNAIDSLINDPATNYKDKDITFVLQGGVTYRMQTLTIPETSGTLKFVTGLSLAGNAEFEVQGNFTVKEGEHVGGFIFDKINFYGAQPEPTDANYGGKYLFNIGNTNTTIDSIAITNCDIKWKRGVIRIQTKATIEHITIDNCLIDSIGGYGIVNADNADAAMNNIKISNSTFSMCQVMFTNNKGQSPNEVSISNCTFWRCGADKKYITDFKGKTIKRFTFDNNLLGPSFGETGLEFYSGDVIPNCNDNYFTSDLVWRVTSDTDPTPKAQIGGTTISTNVAGTFKDAENGDFTVISKDLGVGKAIPGDPRWY